MNWLLFIPVIILAGAICELARYLYFRFPEPIEPTSPVEWEDR